VANGSVSQAGEEPAWDPKYMLPGDFVRVYYYGTIRQPNGASSMGMRENLVYLGRITISEIQFDGQAYVFYHPDGHIETINSDRIFEKKIVSRIPSEER